MLGAQAPKNITPQASNCAPCCTPSYCMLCMQHRVQYRPLSPAHHSTPCTHPTHSQHIPVNFQSVMDRPDLVSRVTPPRTTILNTQALQPPSHQASCRRAESDRPRDRARLGLLLVVAAWAQDSMAGQHRRVSRWGAGAKAAYTAQQGCFLRHYVW
jgi:hypothetical protein